MFTPAEHSRHRVLVVDDNEDLRQLYGAAFKMRGITADMAANGLEAITHLTENGPYYCASSGLEHARSQRNRGRALHQSASGVVAGRGSQWQPRNGGEPAKERARRRRAAGDGQACRSDHDRYVRR